MPYSTFIQDNPSGREAGATGFRALDVLAGAVGQEDRCHELRSALTDASIRLEVLQTEVIHSYPPTTLCIFKA